MKKLKRQIIAELYLIFMILVLIFLYLVLTNFHVHKGLPDSERGSQAEFVYLDEKLYFIDNSIFKNLCATSLEGFRLSERLGINDVRQIVKVGDFIFALCLEKGEGYIDTIYIYNTNNEKIVNKIDLRDIWYGGFSYACTDESGIWMNKAGNGTIFIRITTDGKIETLDMKDYTYAYMLQYYNGELIFSCVTEDEKLTGTYIMNEETGKTRKLSDRAAVFGLIWNNHLLIGKSMGGYHVESIDLESGKVETLPFYCRGNFCICENMLYGTDGSQLCAYDLLKGQNYYFKENGEEYGYDGTVVVDDGKLFFARKRGTDSIWKTKIFYEDIKKIKWKKCNNIK